MFPCQTPDPRQRDRLPSTAPGHTVARVATCATRWLARSRRNRREVVLVVVCYLCWCIKQHIYFLWKRENTQQNYKTNTQSRTSIWQHRPVTTTVWCSPTFFTAEHLKKGVYRTVIVFTTDVSSCNSKINWLFYFKRCVIFVINVR